MSKRVLLNLAVFLAIPMILGIIVLAAFAGVWAGQYSVNRKSRASNVSASQLMTEGAPGGVQQVRPAEPQVFFSANTLPGADLAAAEAQIQMAAEEDIHGVVLALAPPWLPEERELSAVCEPIEAALRANPEARILIRLDLNPPDTWLYENSDACALTQRASQATPSLCSAIWLDAARAAVATLLEHIRARNYPVIGYIPECLEEGRWRRTADYDRSEAAQSVFREWLRTKYKDDDALRAAWADPNVSLASAWIPLQTAPDDPRRVFYSQPAEQPVIDFIEFNSESTAESIAAVASTIKRIAGKNALVIVPYGYTFEYTLNTSGHLSLRSLLEGPVDGFISPVSYYDRGVGGVGGVMGPIHSAEAHGKSWYLIDDTRTGISRDPVTGSAVHLSGIRNEDVEHVLQRNFLPALVHGLGLLWTDSEGKGSLLDSRIWAQFGAMRRIYVGTLDLRNGTPRPAGFFDPYASDVLNVVVDERCRIYQSCDEELNRLLLLEGRDAALVSGLPTRFYLLTDVLDNIAKPASVYLFLNALRLTEAERETLHNLLTNHAATAIWMYAPGYLSESPSSDNISATTGIRSVRFERPASSGSVFLFDAALMRKGDPFGEALEWTPLFYIDDPDPNLTVIANYRESERPSAAIKFMPEGWTSVYVAEPALAPNVLREILLILEKSMRIQSRAEQKPDVVHFGPGIIGIHGRDELERDRALELEQPQDIADLFDPKVGWTNRREVDFPLRFGETRLLQLTPPFDARPAPN